MSTEYNGHATYEHWDVSATIANDEGLYNMACEHAAQYGATDNAAKLFVDELRDLGITRAAGGSEYTWVRVQAALEEYVPEEEEEDDDEDL